jgi:hypothetical protein
MDEPAERVGVLVIRIWTERGSASGLRARITSTVDVATREEVVTTSATIEEICEQFRSWLDTFQAK